MTGPSAMGSENGTPSSIKSAPALSSAKTSSRVISMPGSPAVMYGMKAFRRLPRSSSNRFSMRVTHQPHYFGHILIAAARQIDNHDPASAQLQLLRVGHRVRAFECRND